MARFYVYDLSRWCGFISDDWKMPTNGLYQSIDFKIYFEEESRQAYLIKVSQELAGFILINQVGISPQTNWNMGEFFIIAKFQNRGVGKKVAKQIFDQHPGVWEVSVIPENQSGLHFWEGMINTYTNNKFTRELVKINQDKNQPYRIIFTFASNI